MLRSFTFAAVLLAAATAQAGRGYNPNWHRPYPGMYSARYPSQTYFYYRGRTPWGLEFGGGFTSPYIPPPIYIPAYPTYYGGGCNW